MDNKFHLYDLIFCFILSGIHLFPSKDEFHRCAISKIYVQSVRYVHSSLHEPYRVCRRVNILRDYPDDKTKLYPRN
ncbi:hypothetical protein AhaeAN4_15785 [Acinetobacter haemolyticus]|nr:hypothetical protein AhaeAN4_15785 [Acinetobacter haemolyticus]